MSNEKKGSKVSDLKARLGLKTDSNAPKPSLPGLHLPKPEESPGDQEAPKSSSPSFVPPPGSPHLVPPPGVSLPTQKEESILERTQAEVEYFDPQAGMYVDDDGELDEAPPLSKSLWWLKFAIPSAVVGIILGSVWGYGAFTRHYNDSRKQQIVPLQDSFTSLSQTMDQLLPHVLQLSESTEGKIDLSFPENTQPITKDMNLIAEQALRSFSATFLEVNTLRLLFQYQELTKRLNAALREHTTKVLATKEDLLAAQSGNLPEPSYAVLLTDNTDQGGEIRGVVTTLQGKPSVETKTETIEEEGEEGTPPTQKQVKVTYKTYQLQQNPGGKTFERTTKVREDGSSDVREIVNPEIIPKYGESLLIAHDERVKNLKILAQLIQETQTEIQSALAADLNRDVNFDF